MSFFVSVVGMGVAFTAVLILASLGETLSQCSGNLNVGLEGVMEMGSFAGFVGAYYSGSPWIGLIIGALAGAGVSLIYASLVITAKANQLVAGLGIIFFAHGLVCLCADIVFRGLEVFPRVNYLPRVHIPGLGKSSVVGGIIEQDLVVYALIVILPVCWYILYKTGVGLFRSGLLVSSRLARV